jgi:hypothetical protein
MVTDFFLSPNFLGAFSFGGTLNLTYVRRFKFSFSSLSFRRVQLQLFWIVGVQHFKEKGGGDSMHFFFGYFCDSNFFHKMKYVEQ